MVNLNKTDVPIGKLMKKFHDELTKVDQVSVMTIITTASEHKFALRCVKQINFENGYLEINHIRDRMGDSEVNTLTVLKYKDIIGFEISTRFVHPFKS